MIMGMRLAAAAACATIALQSAPARADFTAAAAYSAQTKGVSLLVLRHGKVVFEQYAQGVTPETFFELASGTKSFWGVAAAAAVQDKLLTLDEPVAGTIVEWRSDPAKARITVRQLLNLTSGLRTSRGIGRPPGYAAALDTPLADPPGQRFSYGAEPFQVFGEVLRRKLIARTETPVDYLRRRILDPIGLKVGRWRTGADGNPVMPSGAQLTAREWAKFGEFVRNGGRVGDRMIVDKATFDAMFVGTAANPAYGLTWWLSREVDPALRASIPQLRRGTDVRPGLPGVPPDLVLAAGAGKQRLYVSAKEGWVVVRQSSRLLELPQPGEAEFSDAAFWEALRR